MVIHNQEIRQVIEGVKRDGINKYHIAYAMGVSESTFARYFRKPLNVTTKSKILNVIAQLKTQVSQ